jgi:hypothetical protein
MVSNPIQDKDKRTCVVITDLLHGEKTSTLMHEHSLSISKSNYQTRIASFMRDGKLYTLGALFLPRKTQSNSGDNMTTQNEDSDWHRVIIYNEMTNEIVAEFEKRKNEKV